jgi:hypothetical protein
MEKNSLGRGLEDISSTFMTPEKESGPLNKAPDLSASLNKKSCTDCINFLEKPQEAPKCKKFSFKYDKAGVPVIDSIMPSFANYCCYFHHVESDKNIKAGTLSFEKSSEEEISFNTEIEETIITHKKISISDNEDRQYRFEKLFSQYLEKDYEVIRIDFRKKEENIESSHRTIKHEEVTIVNKQDTSG